MKKIIPALLFALSTCAALPAFASQITIDFEHTPGADGILGTADDVAMPDTFLQALRDQYASIGLTFTQGSLIQWSFYDGNDSNHFISSASPIALLSKPVTGISIESYSFWDAVLTAYDINGNVIAVDRLVNPDSGVSFLRGELSVTSTQPIYGFSILPDQSNYILNLDNLVLTSSDVASDVPEPPALALFALGLCMVGVKRRASADRR